MILIYFGNKKRILLPLKCFQNEKSCLEGTKLNLWYIQMNWNNLFNANCNKRFNIDSFITILTFPVKRKVVVAISITINSSISGNKVKFFGVRLRELPRSIKSWSGIRLFAPKVFPKGYLAPDNNLWLCRNLLKQYIC